MNHQLSMTICRGYLDPNGKLRWDCSAGALDRPDRPKLLKPIPPLRFIEAPEPPLLFEPEESDNPTD